MFLFGRQLKRKHFAEIPTYINSLIRCFVIFADPLWVIRSYLTQVPPQPHQKVIALRNGKQIFMSAQIHDVFTAFMIFARREYGEINPGQTVVDIGGNTGIFSLYAAVSGASKIAVYEPSSEACVTIRRNIAENGFDRITSLHQRCIDSESHHQVRFPTTSSIFNKPLTGDQAADSQPNELVETISLHDILQDFPNGLDMLKIDCEGCEYTMLLDADPSLLRRINAIRLEYHDDKVDAMIARLAQAGLKMTYHREDFLGAGMLFFERK